MALCSAKREAPSAGGIRLRKTCQSLQNLDDSRASESFGYQVLHMTDEFLTSKTRVEQRAFTPKFNPGYLLRE